MEDYAKQPREERLARLARTPDELASAIAGQDAAALTRRPDEKSWAAVEVVCHLRDIEEALAGRFQMLLAMDELTITPWDVDRWAADRQYLRCDAAESVEAFRTRRAETLQTLRALPPAQWKRAAAHPQRGRMTFEDFVSLLCSHDDTHLSQLKRALSGHA